MSPIELELTGSAGGLNNSYTCTIAAPNQPLNDILRHEIPRILSLVLHQVTSHCWYHPYLLNSSLIMNINVYNNGWIRSGLLWVEGQLCQQRVHEGNHGRLSQTWTWGLVVFRYRVPSWSLQRYNRGIALKRRIQDSVHTERHVGNHHVIHSMLALSPRRLRSVSCSHENGSPVLPLNWDDFEEILIYNNAAHTHHLDVSAKYVSCLIRE